jgi:hypothetical protein
MRGCMWRVGDKSMVSVKVKTLFDKATARID